MKRPLACVGFGMLISLVFATAFHTMAVYAAVVCFVLFLGALFLKRKYKKRTNFIIVCSITVVLSVCLHCASEKLYIEPILNAYAGQTVHFTGTVTDDPYTKNKTVFYTVKTDTVNGEKKSLKISVSSNKIVPCRIYDRIEGTAELEALYENGYGYASYYGARGIFLSAYINTYYGSDYTVTKCEKRPWYYVFSYVRHKTEQTFIKHLDDNEAALCTAMLTGEKRYLRTDVYSRFKSLGISHILVVSGMHLSLIFAAVSLLCDIAVKRFFSEELANSTKIRLSSSAVKITGAVMFAAVSGMGFSVRRALSMIIIIELFRAYDKRVDRLNALGVACIILCINPLHVGDIGMLWSFSCVFSLSAFGASITARFKSFAKRFTQSKIILYFVRIAAASVAAFIGCLPFALFVTGTISPYSVIVNILTVPVTGVIIICGGIAVIFTLLKLSALVVPFTFICGITAKYLIFITSLFSKLPFAVINSGGTICIICAVICGIALTAYWFLNDDHLYIKPALLIVCSLLLGIYSIETVIGLDRITVSTLDVGCGMTVTLKHDKDIVVINSYGEKYQYNTIKNELSKYGDVLCFIDTAPEKGVYNYSQKITNDVYVKNIFVNTSDKFDDNMSRKQYDKQNIRLIESDNSLELFENTSAELIYTNSGVWVRLYIYSKNILICPEGGDYSELDEHMRYNDIIIMSRIPENFEYKGEYVVLSSYGTECMMSNTELQGMNVNSISTNGQGQIDVIFNSNNDVEIKTTYTGGVTRYAKNK